MQGTGEVVWLNVAPDAVMEELDRLCVHGMMEFRLLLSCLLDVVRIRVCVHAAIPAPAHTRSKALFPL